MNLTPLAVFFVAAALLATGRPGGGEEPPELVLVGVIVTENVADSVALLRRSGASRARPVRVGQSIEGYVLLEVSGHSARLESTDREVLLFLPGASQPSEPVSPRESEDVWIRRSFSRNDARERLRKEIPVILSETALSPRVEDGELQGLGVIRLPDGTLVSESGLLPGDVLVSINGEPLRSVESLGEILPRLIEEGEIRVLVRRKEQMLKLAYAFTN